MYFRAPFALALALGTFASAAAAASDTAEQLCWDASVYDLDDDGYADYHAPSDARVTVAVSEALRLTCPAGYVRLRGDCDDSDASVHPRTLEIAFNGIDDNCDGRVDEPRVRYHYDGFNNTTSGFGLDVRVNDEEVVDAYPAGAGPLLISWLSAEIEYQDLSDTSVTLTSGPTRVTTFSSWPAYASAELSLSGLDPNRVYRARVQFYKTHFVFGAFQHTPVGEQSDWYYTPTDATHARGQARAEVVLRALYEMWISAEYGYTGYLGTAYVDGTRYGADMGEAWCSEFYSFNFDWAIGGMGHRESVSRVTDYFDGYSAFTDVDAGNRASVLATLKHGDYLAEDTNLDGDVNHSAMFLAYDSATDQLITVDGNTVGNSGQGDGFASRRGGNEAFIRERDPDVLVGWGSIKRSML